MKTFLFYTFITGFTLLTSHLFATEITKSEAEKVAKNHFFEMTASKGMSYNALHISEAFDIKKEEKTVYYVFNFEKGGFVIVSADDLYTPIIGYSTEGVFPNVDLPDNVQWLMDEYSAMIEYVRKNPTATQSEFSEQWQYLSTDNPADLQKNRTTIVPPLCPALWNQDSPYNYYCPNDPLGPGGKAYAGCVATAMSIIMHYWRWPQQGVGSHSYYPSEDFCGTASYPEQYANFGETEYHFEAMNSQDHNILCEPVSLLMYHCGVAVDMMYCNSGSGAHSYDVLSAIKQYFQYDQSVDIHNKYNFTNDKWIDLLKTDLDKGYPLYNSGCSNEGCHAFVCDGYDSNDMFHYNFGWGGNGDGFYTVIYVGGYGYNQSVITNFIPDQTKYPTDCLGENFLPLSIGSIEDCSGPVANYKANTTTKWLIDPTAGGDFTEKSIIIKWKKFDLASGDYLKIYDGETSNAPLLASYTAGDIPEELNSTQDKVLLVFTTASDSETAQGFLLNFETKVVANCMGNIYNLKEEEGTFNDGSGENYYYPNQSSCRWVIAPPNAKSIKIKFNYFETEEVNDNVRVFDAVHSVELAKLSGKYTTENLPEIIVPSGKVQINFTTNAFINAKGFEISYIADMGTLGIDEETQAVNKLQVFPNPATENINISFSTNNPDNISLSLYSISGQKIYQESLDNFLGHYDNQFVTSDLAKGIYLLRVVSSKGVSLKKIVIQ